MKYLSLSDLVDYVDNASIEFPCTMELVITDDAPVEFRMYDRDEFHETMCDLAGNIGTSGMIDSLGRII
jgi:hypothetical protein